MGAFEGSKPVSGTYAQPGEALVVFAVGSSSIEGMTAWQVVRSRKPLPFFWVSDPIDSGA